MFCCFKLLPEPHLPENWAERWILNLTVSTMTPFCIYIPGMHCVWISQLCSTKEEQRKWGIYSVRACMCTSQMCTSGGCVHVPAPCWCVWIWSGCSLPATLLHPPCFSQQNLCVGGWSWENMWGRTQRSGRETQQTCCLQLTVVSCQSAQGRHPENDTFNICFGLDCMFRSRLYCWCRLGQF